VFHTFCHYIMRRDRRVPHFLATVSCWRGRKYRHKALEVKDIEEEIKAKGERNLSHIMSHTFFRIMSRPSFDIFIKAQYLQVARVRASLHSAATDSHFSATCVCSVIHQLLIITATDLTFIVEAPGFCFAYCTQDFKID
jgi:hypothetical protein